jgi:hypothetical protein
VNYQLKEKEATGGTVFSRESQVHGRGINRKNVIPPGITSSWTLIQVGKIKMQEKSQTNSKKQFQVSCTKLLFTANLHCKCKNGNKIKNKPDPTL